MRLAYPGMEGRVHETLAADQFCVALGDSSLRLAVYQAEAPTLDKAIEVAARMEAYKLMETKIASPQGSSGRSDGITEGDTQDKLATMMRVATPANPTDRKGCRSGT